MGPNLPSLRSLEQLKSEKLKLYFLSLEANPIPYYPNTLVLNPFFWVLSNIAQACP